MKTDSQDRCNIQKKLEELIHPLQPYQHSNELLNIASGKIERDSSVNVTDGVEIGKKTNERILCNISRWVLFNNKKES